MVIARFAIIAFMAAVAAWLPVALILTWDMQSDLAPGFMISLLPMALLGSYAVGFPIAVLTFWLARKHLVHHPSTLALIAPLAGLMMTLASFLLMDGSAAVLFGVPCFIAASTYAVLGWFWILKPMREAETTRGSHV